MLIDIEVLKDLSKEYCKEWRDLAERDRLGPDNLISMLTPAWFITIYIDYVSFPVLIEIFDSFMTHGDKATIVASLALLQSTVRLLKTQDIDGHSVVFQKTQQNVRKVTLEEFRKNFNVKLCKNGDIERLRRKYKMKQAERWRVGSKSIIRRVQKQLHVEKKNFR
eukprot:UN33847